MTRKTRQADMFQDGQDLPIFSGALVQAKQQAAAVPAAQAQPSLIDMRPAFGATEPTYRVEERDMYTSEGIAITIVNSTIVNGKGDAINSLFDDMDTRWSGPWSYEIGRLIVTKHWNARVSIWDGKDTVRFESSKEARRYLLNISEGKQS